VLQGLGHYPKAVGLILIASFARFGEAFFGPSAKEEAGDLKVWFQEFLLNHMEESAEFLDSSPQCWKLSRSRGLPR
jgi:hypothetical protein